MTTLDELKKRATAAELTLIEAVEATLRPAIIHEVTEATICFITNDMPPRREDARFEPDVGTKWVRRLKAHLNDTKPS